MEGVHLEKKGRASSGGGSPEVGQAPVKFRARGCGRTQGACGRRGERAEWGHQAGWAACALFLQQSIECLLFARPGHRPSGNAKSRRRVGCEDVHPFPAVAMAAALQLT